MVDIPDEIDRAIGENARHLVNECGCVVRTKAPLNVKNWQEALSVAGDSMWKEIQVYLFKTSSTICELLLSSSYTYTQFDEVFHLCYL